MPTNKATYAKAHYEANKDAYKAAARRSQERTRERVREIVATAKDRPCADCGVRYPPYVMQFDHLGDKLWDVGNMRSGRFSTARVLAEIQKCEVVCANCHAERTHRRRQERATG